MPSNPPPVAFSDKARRTTEQPISYLMKVAVENPSLISFAAGLVDPLTLPTEETLAITQRLLSDPARARRVMQYGTTHGHGPLREALLHHLEKLEGKIAAAMSLTPDHLIVTTGSQQALYILADILLNPGDIVIAANPSYFVYTGTLRASGARVLTVPMDDDGLRVDLVEELLAKLETAGELHRVKFVYCTSYYHNPTGLTLSTERRQKLVEVVKKFSKTTRIFVLEDAAYRELAYDQAAPPSIKSFDPSNEYVISCYTFSKPFAPGIKTGYGVLPTVLVDAVLQQKGNQDFGSPNLCQYIACEALIDGSYDRHLHVLRDGYRAKRDALMAALERHMPRDAGIDWTRPRGGLYVWLTLPETIDTAREGELFQACLKQGVIYVPGVYCMQPEEDGKLASNHIRLSFGVVPIEKIDAGIQRLATAVRECLDPAEILAESNA